LEERITEFPEQKVSGPLAVITGAAGVGFTVMVPVALADPHELISGIV
jgi:hypothetical protein